jgi:hypothetical protein
MSTLAPQEPRERERPEPEAPAPARSSRRRSLVELAAQASLTDWLIAAGAAFLALALSTTALQALAVRPAILPAFLLGAVAFPLILLRPYWVVPLFIGVTWTFIGQSFFGGLSPVNAGAIVLLPLAAWYARGRPELARATLSILGLVAIPVVVTGLLSPEGSDISTGALKDLLFMFIVAFCVRSVADVDRSAIVLAAVGIFLGAGGAFSVLAHPTTLFPIDQTRDMFGNLPSGAPRAVGPFGEANFFALSLAILTPFCLYLITRGGLRLWLGAAGAAGIVAGVFAAQSRGGLIAIVFALVAMGLGSGQRRMRAAAAFALVAGALGFVVFSAQVTSANERDVSGRATENLIALHMFEDHPVFGVGYDRYPDLYRDYSRKYGDDRRYLREPHSLPLQIAAEEGAVGVLGWIGAFVILIGFARVTGMWRHPIGRTVLVAIATFCVGSLFLHGSLLRLLYVLFGLALAMGTAYVLEGRPGWRARA